MRVHVGNQAIKEHLLTDNPVLGNADPLLCGYLHQETDKGNC